MEFLSGRFLEMSTCGGRHFVLRASSQARALAAIEQATEHRVTGRPSTWRLPRIKSDPQSGHWMSGMLSDAWLYHDVTHLRCDGVPAGRHRPSLAVGG